MLGSNAGGAATRFFDTPAAAPTSLSTAPHSGWRRPDGVVLTDTRNGMFLGLLDAPLNQQAAPALAYRNDYVWTGINLPYETSVPVNSCSNWSSKAAGLKGFRGQASFVGLERVNGQPSGSCSNPVSYRVYCLQF